MELRSDREQIKRMNNILKAALAKILQINAIVDRLWHGCDASVIVNGRMREKTADSGFVFIQISHRTQR
jgi:hypothetical protein